MGIHFLNLWHEWLWPVLQFVIGLGVVVFIHELGHFAVAKAVNIRVEQFALGFGTRLLGFKRGETDYRINLIPLGGYVKLAGQEDFGPLNESDKNDPRSFPNKPIRARLAVISAGVIMNVLLAGALFIIVCLSGIRFPAPVVGGISPGSPAETADIHWQDMDRSTSMGLKPGDRILTLDSRPITRFSQLAAAAELAEVNEEFALGIERQVNGRLIQGISKIRVADMGGIERFGVYPAASMVLGDTGGIITDDSLKAGDRILAINGQPVQYNWKIPEVERHLDGKPATVTIFRNGREIDMEIQPWLQMSSDVFFPKSGGRIEGKVIGYQQGDGTVTIAQPEGHRKILHLDQVIWPARSEILDILGLVPRLRITGVARHSPADRSGLKPGDIVVEYGDRASPSIGEFREISKRATETGATIVILRDGKRIPFDIHPEIHKGQAEAGITINSDLLHPEIADIREGSPAALADINRGDLFTDVSGNKTRTWIELFETLKTLGNKDVAIFTKQAGPDSSVDPVARLGALTTENFSPDDYKYVLFPGPREFKILMGKEVKKNPAAAVIWGFQETWEFMTMTYATLIGYFRGTVSSKEFAGPVGIGSIAIQAGREGIVYFIYFLAVISVSIAVLNFLPLPVVDGGYVVFLLIEKIIGRPVPPKIQNAVTMAGWLLLIFIFVALTWNDILRIMGNR